jgi:hypothetical protein
MLNFKMFYLDKKKEKKARLILKHSVGRIRLDCDSAHVQAHLWSNYAWRLSQINPYMQNSSLYSIGFHFSDSPSVPLAVQTQTANNGSRVPPSLVHSLS